MVVGADRIEPSKLQEAARAWGTTIAGVTTIGGVVTLIQGDSKVAALSEGSQRWLVLALIGALCLAVFAIVAAFSVGWEPVTATSHLRLHASIIATVFALLLLVVAAFILWKGAADAGAQEYLVRYDDNSVACGTLLNQDGSLTFTGGALSGVLEINETNGCPASE